MFKNLIYFQFYLLDHCNLHVNQYKHGYLAQSILPTFVIFTKTDNYSLYLNFLPINTPFFIYNQFSQITNPFQPKQFLSSPIEK